MTKYQINIEVGEKSNGKPDRRHIYQEAKNSLEAEELAKDKIKTYGPQAQIISIYVV